MWLRGYRLNDMVLGNGEVAVVVLPVKPEVRFSRLVVALTETLHRPTNVSRTLAWHVSGASYVKPCCKDPAMTVVGAVKRVGALSYLVKPEDKLLYAEWVVEHFYPMFTPLSKGEETSVEDWIEGLDFPQSRKDELRYAAEELALKGLHFDDPEWLEWFCELMGFIKDEFYDSIKASRWINARGDRAKAFFGPMAQDIMNVLKKHPSIIKTVPTEQRPSVIMETLFRAGARYQGTDYTSFEAHFVEWLMEISGRFYCYILRNHPKLELLKKFYKTTICGANRSKMRNFGSFLFLCLRCSGEMDTSLGNTFHNLATYLFLVHMKGGECRGFVEGDDGLFLVYPDHAVPTEADFRRFGWIIKIAEFSVLGDTSFCGNVFAHEDLIVVTDPRKVLLTLGWAPKRYVGASEKFLLSLLKSKVLSMACSYGRNPIVWAASKRLLELLTSVKVRKTILENTNWYHKQQLRTALEEKFDVGPPPMATRHLVARLYHISVDTQLQLEAQLLNMDLGPWEASPDLFPRRYFEYWDKFVGPKWEFHIDRENDEWNRQLSTQCVGRTIKPLKDLGGMYEGIELSKGYSDNVNDPLGTLESHQKDKAGGKLVKLLSALHNQGVVDYQRARSDSMIL